MATEAAQAADAIQARDIAGVEIAFVLPAGLGNMAEGVENPIVVPFADLPGFPTVPQVGHDGQIVFGTHEGASVAYMHGRAFYHEQGRPDCMLTPLEALAMLGAQIVVMVGPGGSLNADLQPGNLVLVSDHINVNGVNPLIGSGGDGGMISMVDAYDPRLARRFKRATLSSGVSLRDGVFMWMSGPSFETPAETRMARALGADLVGLSIAPEIILARRLGLRAAGIVLVSGYAAGFRDGNPSLAETRQTAAQAAISLKRLLRSFLRVKELDAK